MVGSAVGNHQTQPQTQLRIRRSIGGESELASNASTPLFTPRMTALLGPGQPISYSSISAPDLIHLVFEILQLPDKISHRRFYGPRPPQGYHTLSWGRRAILTMLCFRKGMSGTLE